MSECLLKIHVFRPSSVEDFSNLINMLEDYAIENDVGMLVIDSIASLLRREITTTSKKSIFMRGHLQATWMMNLKRLAQGLNLCVVLTNQIATEIRLNDKFDKISVQQTEEGGPVQQGITQASSYHMIPALGYKWSFYVNTRFILQYTSTVKREMIIAKSPVSPYSSFYFTIEKHGISIEESGCKYSNSGCNPGHFKIKARTGINI
ncbi:DNA repair protein RAD51 homolog 2-like [Palaemon carinicauda]|uniref:DNA repair protein RAD51 homolog 2-like n=1 Tax=Palaemon carinicauda TaxID=392227 RepID=UPI0035B618CA